jgi:hypothetical protein
MAPCALLVVVAFVFCSKKSKESKSDKDKPEARIETRPEPRPEARPETPRNDTRPAGVFTKPALTLRKDTIKRAGPFSVKIPQDWKPRGLKLSMTRAWSNPGPKRDYLGYVSIRYSLRYPESLDDAIRAAAVIPTRKVLRKEKIGTTFVVTLLDKKGGKPTRVTANVWKTFGAQANFNCQARYSRYPGVPDVKAVQSMLEEICLSLKAEK